MKTQKFNKDWKFWIDRNSFALVWSIPEQARTVDLPHDAMIEQPACEESRNGGDTGFRDGDIYTYVNHLRTKKEDANTKMVMKFEGVYMNAFVYVNGQLAAHRPYGYSTFYVPLNDYLKYGEENEIRVQVKNGASTSGRWYTGGGIYRDVYLLTSDLLYIRDEGVQIKTIEADNDYAIIQIQCEVNNEDSNRREFVLENVITDCDSGVVTEEKSRITLFAGEKRKIVQRIVVDAPQLWSAAQPVLYTCSSRILDCESKKEIDENTQTFGIRTIQIDAKRGLRVNGKKEKLRGACIHHDSGLLGTATFEEAEYRRVRKLKEAGFNAIRMSHQPMAQVMLRACDEIGMYVMDETFDMWTRMKSNYDYGLYFNEWWEKDITAMIRKDYNHPSVILYSIGNEIPEIGTDAGAKMCYELCAKVKNLDDTRYTLASINGVFAVGNSIDEIMKDIMVSHSSDEEDEGSVNDFMTLMDEHMDEITTHKIVGDMLEKATAAIDVAGYNYMAARYEMDGIDYPNRVIVGSETYPPQIAKNWEKVKKMNHVIGDFTWTGWDYIGEAGVGVPAYHPGEGGFGAGFPCQLAYTGDFDITGFRRPASYYREIVFGLRKEPYIAVQKPEHYSEKLIKTPWVISDAIASWTWNGFEKKPIKVEVYANSAEIELLLNGHSLGRKPAGEKKYLF